MFLFLLLFSLFELIRELAVVSFIDVDLSSDFIVHEFGLLDGVGEIVVVRLDFFAALLNHISERVEFSAQRVDLSFVLFRRLLLVDDLFLQFRRHVDQRNDFLLQQQRFLLHRFLLLVHNVALFFFRIHDRVPLIE